MSIRLPRLLNAYQKERARLHPIRLSLHLRMKPLSTAEMILPDSDAEVAVRDLVELYDENGSVGIFRVSGVDVQPGLTRTVYLEHGLTTLSDSVIPAMAFTGSVRECLERLLGYQSDIRWALGDTDAVADTTVIFTCGYENLLSALGALMSLLPDTMMLDFDQSGSVWVLHLRQLSDEDACEGRLSRNLTGVEIAMDGSDLCTRVYPLGAGQGSDRITLTPLTGLDYLQSEAAATWGIICRTFTAGRVFDVPTLKLVAEKYLARHSMPTVSVTAQAVDLSRMTGEDADSFRLGRMCRLALPEYQLTLHERVVALDKPDVFSSPGLMTVTLSNQLSDASDEIADMLREVTADKLIGGRVTDVTTHSRANGQSSAPVEHYFHVESWAAVLACLVSLDPDDGVSIVDVRMDQNPIPDEVWRTGSFDALAYMKRDELGVITTGRHTLAIYPNSGAVNSTVTLKVIESA